MKQQLNIVTTLHKNTERDYLGRANDQKIGCMKTARKFGYDFWDGDRRFGYGGYNYDGRWAVVAQKLIDQYGLGPNSNILDVGCGKGFLLYEFRKLLPEAKISGIDISEYAIENAKEEIRDNLMVASAQEPFPFEDGQFDLVISLTTLHNLLLPEFKMALSEIERVGKEKYILLDSYRDEAELFNLQCWTLTCELFFRPEEWVFLFNTFSYTGDYEFIFFE